VNILEERNHTLTVLVEWLKFWAEQKGYQLTEHNKELISLHACV